MNDSLPCVEKPRVKKTARAVERPIAWGMLLGAIEDEKTRAAFSCQFRAAGFTPDDFGHKRPSRLAALEAFVAAEDAFELAHPFKRRERAAMQAVRRRLEREVWP